MVQLPQELIDAIIDQFAPRGDDTLPNKYWVPEAEKAALSACSLASRIFLCRSRQHLFAGIEFYTDCSSQLEDLVSESPDILTSYLKYFSIVFNCESELEDGLDFTLASSILALAPKLVHLDIYVNLTRLGWDSQPSLFKNAVYQALQLPHLRSLSLGHYTFASVMELEYLLSHAHGLKELILDMISFEDTSARPANAPSHEPLVVLDSLDVGLDGTLRDDVIAAGVDAMLSTFSMVDIKHLQSLRVMEVTPLLPFLRANSRTFQKVQTRQPLGASKPLS
jgi:hypothetical protein